MFDRDAIERARRLAAAWEANELRQLRRAPAGSADPLRDPVRAAGEPGLYAGRRRRHALRRDRAARPVPYTRGPYPTMYRGAHLDHAADRGLRHRRGHQRALPLSHRARADRAQRRLRHADPDGLRLRRSRRSLGEVGREGVAVDTLDDMEALFRGIDLERISVSMTINPSAWILLAMYVALAESARLSTCNRLVRHRAGRHPQGVHRPEGVDLPDPPLDADHARHDRRTARATWRATTRSTSAGITSPRRARPACRRWPSPWPTRSPTWRRSRARAWPSTSSRRGWPSTSWPRPTSSRRWRSTGRPGASGPSS